MESLIINEMTFLSIYTLRLLLKVVAVSELFIANDLLWDTFRRKFITCGNET